MACEMQYNKSSRHGADSVRCALSSGGVRGRSKDLMHLHRGGGGDHRNVGDFCGKKNVGAQGH